MKLKMMILSLLCGINVHNAKAQDTDLPRPTKAQKLVQGKVIKVGKFQNGKDWHKLVSKTDFITTDAQLKAFYKTLGKKEADVPEIDFARTMLYVDKWPSWDMNSRSYSCKIDGKGDLTMMMWATEKGYRKPKEGPYFTSIALAEVSRKGVKTYRGRPLVEFKSTEAGKEVLIVLEKKE